MKVTYTQLREDLMVHETVDCDSYKYDLHPVTGKITLQLFDMPSNSHHLKALITNVMSFHVTRVP